jgi:hypothetical protein
MIENIIKKILRESITEEQKQPLDKREILMFKHLNKHKHKYRTQKDLIEFIRSMLPVFGRDKTDARLYYEVYTQNYREEGDYENITFENFKNYKDFVQRRVTNSSAYGYSSNKIPFKGSNLEGYWNVNSKNQWYYIVKSYGWYPIFLFINNQWYGVIETYSSTTSKQMSHSNPVRYNSGLNSEVIFITKNEIEELMKGYSTYDELLTNRVEKFTNNVGQKLIGKKTIKSFGWGDNAKKVSFTIEDVTEDDNKILIKIRINKAGPIVDRKMVVDPEGYDKRGDFAKDLEKNIAEFVIRENIKFLTKNNTKFEFSH